MDIPLMAKCHLPQSMTKIYGQNFKKNVIDDGQWQKNCHLLKGIYPFIDDAGPTAFKYFSQVKIPPRNDSTRKDKQTN